MQREFVLLDPNGAVLARQDVHHLSTLHVSLQIFARFYISFLLVNFVTLFLMEYILKCL